MGELVTGVIEEVLGDLVTGSLEGEQPTDPS